MSKFLELTKLGTKSRIINSQFIMFIKSGEKTGLNIKLLQQTASVFFIEYEVNEEMSKQLK